MLNTQAGHVWLGIKRQGTSTAFFKYDDVFHQIVSNMWATSYIPAELHSWTRPAKRLPVDSFKVVRI